MVLRAATDLDLLVSRESRAGYLTVKRVLVTWRAEGTETPSDMIDGVCGYHLLSP
jgi:hypothetical protein